MGWAPGPPDQPHLRRVLRLLHHALHQRGAPAAGRNVWDDWYVICPDMETADAGPIREQFARLGLELNKTKHLSPAKRHRLLRVPHLPDQEREGGQKAAVCLHQADETTHPPGSGSMQPVRSRGRKSWSFWLLEAHAKHGDTRQLRTEMRARLEASLARAHP